MKATSRATGSKVAMAVKNNNPYGCQRNFSAMLTQSELLVKVSLPVLGEVVVCYTFEPLLLGDLIRCGPGEHAMMTSVEESLR